MTIGPVLIVATGPSLTVEDVAHWREGRKVIAVNDAYRLIPDAILYSCDEQWWDVHERGTRYHWRWTTNDVAARKYGLQHIPGQHADAARKYFDASGNGIIYGGNSGFQALNLAYALGSRDALLLGFDMGQAPGEPSHWFGEHPSACDNPRPYRAWLKHWQRAVPEIAAAGMTVRNATRGGALDVFPRVALADAGL